MFVEWRNPAYPPKFPPRPAEEGGALRSQPPWICLYPLRGVAPSELAARSLERLAKIDHRARRLLGGGTGPQRWDTGYWDSGGTWPA